MSKANGNGTVFFSFALPEELNERMVEDANRLHMNKRSYVTQAIQEKLDRANEDSSVSKSPISEFTKEEFENLRNEVAALRKITDALTMKFITTV